MPRGRKRKFVPRPWIPNSSSEDDHDGHGHGGDVPLPPLQLPQREINGSLKKKS